MDENIGAVDTVELGDVDYLEGWNDDSDVTEDSSEAEEGEEVKEAEEQQDQQPEEPVDEKPEENAAKDSEPEKPKAESKSWKLKHNGEEVDADEAKMVELAQKGLDYDRVRGERDTFKNEHPKYAEYETFLNELAKSAGTDVPGLMENVRAAMLMQKSEEAGNPITKDAAIKQLNAQKESAKAAADADAKKKQDNIKAFISSYPGIKAEDIPVDVLREGFERGDLSGAYARYENKKLKEELEVLKQNQKNKERSTGSKKRSSAVTADPWFEGWEDD